MATQVASLYADIGAKVDGFEKGAAKVLGGLGKLALSVGAVTTAIEIMSQSFNFAKEGAQLERLADSGAEIARQFGGNMDMIVEKVKRASLGTVSEMDIIRSANKAMMLGLGADAEQLANLMEIAAFRGRAMGLSTTQAFDDIVRGIGRTSPMILDNLGIVVSAKDTYKKYADEVGKSASELTKQEKTQALLNRVLEEGNSLLEEAGGLVEDNASQYEKLTARVQDYKDSVKRSMNEAITPSLEAFLDMADAMDAVTESTGRTDQRSRIYLGALQLQAEQEQELQERINSTSAARWSGLAALYTGTAAIIDNTEATEENSEANEEFLSVLGSIQDESESYAEEYKKINGDMSLSDDERKLKLQELANEHEMTNRRIILGLLERKLTQDGLLDDRELEFLLEKGQAWGIYSDTVIEQTRRAINEANALIDGLITEKTFTLTLNAIYGTASANSNQGAQTIGEVGKGRRRAGGGSVSAGQSYLVGEQGMELFTPNQSGYITPNDKIATSGGMTINIMLDSATPDPDKVAYNLAPAVERVLRQRRLI